MSALTGKCRWCGKEFLKCDAHRLYCSSECAKLANKQIHRERKKDLYYKNKEILSIPIYIPSKNMEEIRRINREANGISYGKYIAMKRSQEDKYSSLDSDYFEMNMTINTYLKCHPETKEFWLQGGNFLVFCRADSSKDMKRYGFKSIIRIEKEPAELVTLHVK